MTERKTIQEYMLENIQDHIDPKTGEVNDTSLAEDACQHFNDYENGDFIPERYFEYSMRVAIRYEVKTGIIPNRIGSAIGGIINSVNSDFTINR